MKRLRDWAAYPEGRNPAKAPCTESADEIERLRAALKLAQSLDDPLLLEIERQRQHISALEKALTVIAGTEDVQWSRHIAARHIAREALAKGNE